MNETRFLTLLGHVKPAVRRAASVIRKDFKNLPYFPSRGEVDSFALDGLMYVAEKRGLDGPDGELLSMAVNKAKWLILDNVRSEIRHTEFKDSPVLADLLYNVPDDPAEIVANEQQIDAALATLRDEVGERDLYVYLEDKVSQTPQADIAKQFGISERRVREITSRVSECTGVLVE